MLSEQERREVTEELAHHPTRRAATVETLKIVQKHRGWVSDEALADLAGLIGVPAAELDGVATFFNLIYRQPVGKNVILLCDSVSCWLMGCDKLRACIEDELGIGYGQTTADDRFTLLPMACLGTCDHAPAVMIGEELHQDLTPEKLAAIVRQTE